MDEKKKKAIEEALKQIEKQFGKGTVMQLGDKTIVKVDVIPTGSIGLDYALGVGGVPRGRIVEIFGQEASGKTTLALHIIAEAQKRGGIAAFIDAEHALDPKYASNIGVNVENLLISQPDTGEQALEIAETLIRSGGIDLIVVDSVAALVPKAEIDGEMGDAHVGLQARLMSQALRKLTGVLNKSYTSAVFINQVRYKIGMMFGPQYTTPGGLALKFHSSVRIDIRNLGAIKEGDENIGMRVSCKVVKNKLAPPFKSAEFDIIYGQGISKEGELIDIGINLGIIEKTGAWYSYKDEKIGQGREKVRAFLIENPNIREKIEKEIRKKLSILDENQPEGKGKETTSSD